MKRHRYYIEPLEFSVNGYTHRIRRTTSTDNGKTFRASGVVEHFRSEVEARKYKRRLETGPNAWQVFYNKNTNKELAAYTTADAMPGEYDETLCLLCFCHDLSKEEIVTYREIWER